MCAIRYSAAAVGELRSVPAFRRRRVVDAIKQQLAFEPTRPTRNRKALPGAAPMWEHVPPVWELRVGDYRVFYDVDEDAVVV